MQLIAAIDLWGGRVVRLRQGDFQAQEEISANPLALGERLLSWGLHWWHIVDLMGAKGESPQWMLLESLRRNFPQVRMNLGGGLRSDAAVARAVEAGFDHLVIGSAAVETPAHLSAWIRLYGAERFILAADLRGGQIAVRGWQAVAPIPVERFLSDWCAAGIRLFLCTEVERDGMLSGPDPALYAKLVAQAAPAHIIASGGIRNGEDLQALAGVGVTAAVVGKALYTDPRAPEWIRNFC